ncbi:hypothetical protein [Agromyces sp. NPDC058064]|uniref:hypothetical protein n=1 Tax=Agromyces sp. NPDC058064 TaxID=3346322 RepID=UPI0036D8AC79
MSGFDDAFDEMYEEFAQSVAAAAREDGLRSADEVEIDTESDSPGFTIDIARVRRRANEILAESR